MSVTTMSRAAQLDHKTRIAKHRLDPKSRSRDPKLRGGVNIYARNAEPKNPNAPFSQSKGNERAPSLEMVLAPVLARCDVLA